MNDISLSQKVNTLSNDDLVKKLVFFKRELLNLRFQQTLGELKNTSRFLKVKKHIAQIKTELTKRSMLGD